MAGEYMVFGSSEVKEIKESLKDFTHTVQEALKELKEALKENQQQISVLIQENVKISTAMFGVEGNDGFYQKIMNLEKELEKGKEVISQQLSSNEVYRSKLLETVDKVDKTEDEIHNIKRNLLISQGIMLAFIFGPYILANLHYFMRLPDNVEVERPKIEIPGP